MPIEILADLPSSFETPPEDVGFGSINLQATTPDAAVFISSDLAAGETIPASTIRPAGDTIGDEGNPGGLVTSSCLRLTTLGIDSNVAGSEIEVVFYATLAATAR